MSREGSFNCSSIQGSRNGNTLKGLIMKRKEGEVVFNRRGRELKKLWDKALISYNRTDGKGLPI